MVQGCNARTMGRLRKAVAPPRRRRFWCVECGENGRRVRWRAGCGAFDHDQLADAQAGVIGEAEQRAIARKPTGSSSPQWNSARRLSLRGESRSMSETAPLRRSGAAWRWAAPLTLRIAASVSLTSGAVVGSAGPSNLWSRAIEAGLPQSRSRGQICGDVVGLRGHGDASVLPASQVEGGPVGAQRPRAYASTNRPGKHRAARHRARPARPCAKR